MLSTVAEPELTPPRPWRRHRQSAPARDPTRACCWRWPNAWPSSPPPASTPSWPWRPSRPNPTPRSGSWGNCCSSPRRRAASWPLLLPPRSSHALVQVLLSPRGESEEVARTLVLSQKLELPEARSKAVQALLADPSPKAFRAFIRSFVDEHRASSGMDVGKIDAGYFRGPSDGLAFPRRIGGAESFAAGGRRLDPSGADEELPRAVGAQSGELPPVRRGPESAHGRVATGRAESRRASPAQRSARAGAERAGVRNLAPGPGQLASSFGRQPGFCAPQID